MKGDHRQACSYKSNIEGMLVQRFTDLVTQGSCARCASLVRVCDWGLISEELNTEGRASHET